MIGPPPSALTAFCALSSSSPCLAAAHRGGMAEEFGDDVKFWITINEPAVTAVFAYGTGGLAPGKFGPGTNTYIVARWESQSVLSGKCPKIQQILLT